MLNRNLKITSFLLLLYYAAVIILGIRCVYIIYPITLYLCVSYPVARPIRRAILVFIIPSAVALVIGLLQRYELHDVIKDYAYFFIPVTGLCLGSFFNRKYGTIRFLEAQEVSGKIISIIFLTFMLAIYGSDILYKAREIRETIEGGLIIDLGFIPVVTCGILLYKILYFNQKHLIKDTIWLLICTLAIIVSGSRTYFISLIIYIISIITPLFRQHLVRSIISVGIMAAIIITVITTNSSFKESLSGSFEEIDIHNTEQLNENDNYRGYEARMTLATVLEYKTINKLLGGGAGATVDMGTYAPIRRFVPITHNGYAYILLKFGIIGIILILAFGAWALWYIVKWHTKDLSERLIKYISIASIISLYAANYVIWGIFNELTLILTTITGSTISYIYRQRCYKYR